LEAKLLEISIERNDRKENLYFLCCSEIYLHPLGYEFEKGRVREFFGLFELKTHFLQIHKTMYCSYFWLLGHLLRYSKTTNICVCVCVCVCVNSKKTALGNKSHSANVLQQV
jgi:hypothetical protein